MFGIKWDWRRSKKFVNKLPDYDNPPPPPEFVRHAKIWLSLETHVGKRKSNAVEEKLNYIKILEAKQLTLEALLSE